MTTPSTTILGRRGAASSTRLSGSPLGTPEAGYPLAFSWDEEMTYGTRRSGRRRVRTSPQTGGERGATRGEKASPADLLEKYRTLARTAALNGDPVAEEDYSQRAEHYYRMLQQQDV